MSEIKNRISRYYDPKISGFSECLSQQEKDEATKTGSSLLYGEVLPEGVVKLLDSKHLNIREATCIFDLGAGLGKLALQTFMQYTNVKEFVGVELSVTRFQLSHRATRTMVRDSLKWTEPATRGLLEVVEDSRDRIVVVERLPTSEPPASEEDSAVVVNDETLKGAKERERVPVAVSPTSSPVNRDSELLVDENKVDVCTEGRGSTRGDEEDGEEEEDSDREGPCSNRAEGVTNTPHKVKAQARSVSGVVLFVVCRGSISRFFFFFSFFFPLSHSTLVLPPIPD